MTVQSYIENIIAPKIQGDGGWVEFDSLSGNELTLVFRGECAKCKILNRCTDWLEGQLKADLNMDLKIKAVCIKPYFQEV